MNGSDRKFSANVLKVASVVTGLTLWHLVSVYVINDSALLVSPVVVVKTTYEMLFVTGELYPHLFASSGIFFTALSWRSSPVCRSASSWR
jgi:ABC-type nitrate/sulfonate/bicarbonate transport system permease component